MQPLFVRDGFTAVMTMPKRKRRIVPRQPRPHSVSPLERVQVDSLDSSQDRLIPRGEAQHRLQVGELKRDLITGKLAVLIDGVCPDWLKDYNRAG